MIHLVLLSGGSGTRLWPLSNDTRSKQFLKVLRDDKGAPQSMVQRVFAQISRIDANVDITVATAASQATAIEQQLPNGSYELVIEPERRDTMPAIILACAHISEEPETSVDDTVIVMPIDTFAEQGYYDSVKDIDRVVRSGDFDLVLLGVAPTYPSEKYGYIVPKEDSASDPLGRLEVSRFVEKPSEEAAICLLKQNALWNCGVFAFKLGYLLSLIEKEVGALGYEDLSRSYQNLPKTSFDYGVVEKADSIAVVSYKGSWKDLGTWNTLSEEMVEPSSGNVVIDDESCDDVCVINETGLPLVVAGLSDSVVVATHDGLLVTSKERSAHIKDLVESVKESRPMYEKRKWGEYRVIDMGVYPDGRKSLTKELVVKEGQQLSYQKHESRSEVWTIVSGEGEIVLDGETEMMGPGSVVKIDAGTRHALRAKEEMHIIEVQLGGQLEEADISRSGYFWSDDIGS